MLSAFFSLFFLRFFEFGHRQANEACTGLIFKLIVFLSLSFFDFVPFECLGNEIRPSAGNKNENRKSKNHPQTTNNNIIILRAPAIVFCVNAQIHVYLYICFFQFLSQCYRSFIFVVFRIVLSNFFPSFFIALILHLSI